MDRPGLSPLLRPFERHLRALNRSDNTIESYLEATAGPSVPDYPRPDAD
jgi:hypothetical protein